MKSKAILVLLTLLLTPLQVLADPYDNLLACINALDYDSTLQPISDKVSLTGKTDRLFSMLANESYPTSNEKEVILAWVIKRERCVSDNPLPVNIVTHIPREGMNAVQSLSLELYKGAMTYGQFAKKLQDIRAAMEASREDIMRQYQRQQSQQRQYQQQLEEYQYQACMNRASKDPIAAPFDRANCMNERAARQLGGDHE